MTVTAALRGRREQRGGAAGQRDRVDDPQRAQDPRPLRHRGVQATAADRSERDHGQRAAGAEGHPDGDAERGIAERDGDAGQRPHREAEDEGREAEPEQDSVEAGRERHRHHAAPRLRDLAADLRDDPRAPRLADRRRERDGRRHRGRSRAERAAEQREAAERHDPAGQRPGGERRAGDRGRPQPPGVAGGRERLHHREAARRPRAGHAGRDGGDRDHRRQHFVFVS